MSGAILEQSVWDLLFDRVFVDPTNVLLSEMNAKPSSEWFRLIPDEFCLGVRVPGTAMLLFSCSSSTHVVVVLWRVPLKQ
jgi:hypothetical protein